MISLQLSHLGEGRAVDHDSLSCHHDVLRLDISLHILVVLQLLEEELLIVVLLLLVHIEVSTVKVKQTVTQLVASQCAHSQLIVKPGEKLEGGTRAYPRLVLLLYLLDGCGGGTRVFALLPVVASVSLLGRGVV